MKKVTTEYPFGRVLTRKGVPGVSVLILLA